MKPTILIVEDEFLIAMEMQSHLESEGYVVVGIASDFASALSFTGNRVDIALVDLNLRDGLTGPEIGRLFAEEHGAAVLFVTANPSVLGTGIAGTIGVLTKPTDRYSLTHAVDFAARRRSGEPAEPPRRLQVFG